MSNYKTTLFFICSIALLYGCKPYTQFFSYDHTINKEFFDGVRPLMNVAGQENDSIRVYRAWLRERLVERDEVPEYKLINEKSKQEYANLPDTKNFQYLYLFELFPKGSGDTVIVYMGTGYSPDTVCTGIGPAYAGKLRNTRVASQIQFDITFRIKKIKKIHLTDDEKKEWKNSKMDKYVLDPIKYTNMVFINRTPFIQEPQTDPFIQVTQIIRSETNKIGGEKAVIFTTNKVFGDPAALVFTYFSTLK